MNRSVRGLLSVSVLVCLSLSISSACRASPGLQDVREGELQEIPFPDLSQLEDHVAKQLEEARAVLLSRMQAEDVSAGELLESYGELGRLYHAYDLPEAAEACYLNARALGPADYRWPYLMARLQHLAGRLDEAEHNYHLSLLQWPDRLAALVYLGDLYLEQNRLADAETALSRALSIAPSSPAALARLGQLALERRDYEQAIALLEHALSAVPQANLLHYPLAMAYRGLGQIERAREQLALRGTVGVRPPDPLVDDLQELTRGEIVHVLRGRAAYRAGHLETAAEEFQAAVEMRSESVRARVNLGSVLGTLGRTDAAIEELEEALRLEPDNLAAHFNLGLIFAQQGRGAEAEPHFKRVLQLDPRDREALEQYGALQRQLGEPDMALSAYRQILDLDPRDEAGRIGEAEVLANLSLFSEAGQSLEEGLTLVPQSGLIAHAMARFLVTVPDSTLRDGERGLDLALRVYHAQPTVRHAETVALALAEQDRCEEAADWQEASVVAARKSDESDLATNLEAALNRYRGGSPCRAAVLDGG